MGARTILLLAVALSGCGPGHEPAVTDGSPPVPGKTAGRVSPSGENRVPTASVGRATFAGGCFWCTEAIYSELDGVISALPGYTGGKVPRPTYEAVCTGTTGHAEAVQVTYDPAKVRYEDLLEVFFKTHDPTTRDRQGQDAGAQYRSAVFTHDAAQQAAAERIRRELDASGAFPAPIVTEIVPIGEFWPAEDYHRDYFRKNPDNAYCAAVIRPKMDKLRRVFRDRVKRRGS